MSTLGLVPLTKPKPNLQTEIKESVVRMKGREVTLQQKPMNSFSETFRFVSNHLFPVRTAMFSHSKIIWKRDMSVFVQTH